jgi:hypothetical protein
MFVRDMVDVRKRYGGCSRAPTNTRIAARVLLHLTSNQKMFPAKMSGNDARIVISAVTELMVSAMECNDVRIVAAKRGCRVLKGETNNRNIARWFICAAPFSVYDIIHGGNGKR